ncbi:MAG TPA: ornithine cyclodeaminase family protein [Gemmatimonadaceae bacterium]|nr:ornithine cyclodeaminase family protein [Gemmatimonadaceae bacterium]
MRTPPTILIARSRIRELLPIKDCIAAVEAAFAAASRGKTTLAGVLGSHVADGGFHVKTAGLQSDTAYFAAKINANFPMNPSRSGRPTIQGVLVLYDATNGDPLAVMDSGEITRIRTAAATAVAAKYLSRVDASSVAICGCGVQAAAQLEALCAVRPIVRVFAYDLDSARAQAFAADATDRLHIEVRPVSRIAEGSTRSDIVVTCTPSTRPILGPGDVAEGAFVAAVGADSEHKHEIDVQLMARSAVVVDVLSQCAAIGDLHHAIDAGAMSADDVRAELADVVSGSAGWSRSHRETVVFDSTGTALEDVAAAAMLYERARANGNEPAFDFAS